MRLHSTPHLPLDMQWRRQPSYVFTMTQAESWHHFLLPNHFSSCPDTKGGVGEWCYFSLFFNSKLNKQTSFSETWLRVGINVSPFCFSLTEFIRIIYFFGSYYGLLLITIVKISLGSQRVYSCFKRLLSPNMTFLEFLMNVSYVFIERVVRWPHVM